MQLDQAYKTVSITDDMLDERKVASILARVAHFIAMSDTLMSSETILKIIGNDAYSELTLDAVGKLGEGFDPVAMTEYIRHELQERHFESVKLSWRKRLGKWIGGK